jgi:hypothetical protein
VSLRIIKESASNVLVSTALGSTSQLRQAEITSIDFGLIRERLPIPPWQVGVTG